MNQGFKLRFDQMRESDPSAADAAQGVPESDMYQQPSYARNLCLIWSDGRRMFLNYAYLIAAEFEPNTDINLIKLSFSSHTVLLTGYGLENLFMALFEHQARLVTAIDPRYVLADDKPNGVVIAISVERTNE
jgi:hypothetical protein